MQSAFDTPLYEALTYLSTKSDEADEQEARQKQHDLKQRAKRR
jgi:hypothetical protein